MDLAIRSVRHTLTAASLASVRFLFVCGLWALLGGTASAQLLFPAANSVSDDPAPAGQSPRLFEKITLLGSFDETEPAEQNAKADEVEPASYECVAGDGGRPRSLQFLPDGLIYKSYIAGEREPRFGSVWLWERGRGWVWETALGGRIGLLRHGTAGPFRPEGWQFDMEGAVFPRIDPVLRSEMDAVDFRAGLLLTWRGGDTVYKAGYYHLSNHVGDEFLLRNPTFHRIEYVRDSAIAGFTHFLTEDTSVYAEIGYAVNALGGAEPWEVQFGCQYSPMDYTGHHGAPVLAINGHLREDFNFSGSMNAIAGWQWRSTHAEHLFRVGFQYFNGKSMQYQFFDKNEQLFGGGLWYDF